MIYNMARGLPTQEFENDDLNQDIEDIKDSYRAILDIEYPSIDVCGGFERRRSMK